MKLMRILATKTGDVITVHPEQQIRDAVRLLAEHNIGALVVVDDAKKPVGIISERDIVRRAAANEGVLTERVRDIMTKRVIIGVPQDDLYSVINTMTEKRFRHLPIMDEGRLIGIISIGDIVKAQRDAYEGEIDTLETQIMADTE